MTKKIYGVRVYKDGKSCAEFTYYSLEEIYTRTINYEDNLDLSNGIKSIFKEKYPDFYNKDSLYEAKIVYYPNKQETERISKTSEYGEFKSNGIYSEYVPIMYKKDSNIFNSSYIKDRFFGLMLRKDGSFRAKLMDFYDSSMVLATDKDGKPKKPASLYLFENILEISEAINQEFDYEYVDFLVEKLYKKIFGSGFRERTKIYTIMEREFPRKVEAPVVQAPIQTEMDFRTEIPWIDYFSLPEEEKPKYKKAPIQKGDAQRLVELMSNKENRKKR